MIIADLLALSSQHKVIICEGDIDYKAVIPVASHAIYLCNHGTKFDWFARHTSIEQTMHEVEHYFQLQKNI